MPHFCALCPGVFVVKDGQGEHVRGAGDCFNLVGGGNDKAIGLR